MSAPLIISKKVVGLRKQLLTHLIGTIKLDVKTVKINKFCRPN